MAFRLSSVSWKWVLALVGLAVLSLLVLVRVFATTGFAMNMVESRIESMTVRGNSIQIDGLSGDLLRRVRARSISVSDGSGVWIEMQDVSLSWAPVSLLRRQLTIKDLSVSSLSMERRPQLETARPSGAGSPINGVRIEALQIPRLTLGEGVAGRSQTFSANADLRSESGRTSLRAQLTPAEAGGDTLDVALLWDGRALPSGTLALSGQPGGLFAALLGASEGEPVSARLVSDLEGSRMTLQLEGQVGQSSVVEASGQLSEDQFELEGRMTPSLLSLLEPVDRISGGPVDFDVSLGIGSEDTRPLRARVDSANLSVDLSGDWKRNSEGLFVENLDAVLDLNEAAATLQQNGVGIERLQITGDLSRSGGGTRFEGEINSDRLGLFGAKLGSPRAAGSVAQLAGGELIVNADLTAKVDSVQQSTLSEFAGKTIRSTVRMSRPAQASGVDIDQLILSTDGLDLRASGGRSSEGRLALEGTLNVRDRVRFENASLDWTLVRARGAPLELEVGGKVKPVGTGGILRLFDAEMIDIEGQVSRGSDGVLDVTRLNASAGPVAITGRGDYQSGRLDFSAKVLNRPLAIGGVALETGNGSLDLSGPVGDLAVNLVQDISEVRIASLGFGQTRVEFNLETSPGLPIAASVTSSLDEAELSLAARGGLADRALQIASFEARALGLIADGRGEVPFSDPLSGVAVFDVSGTAYGDIDVEATGELREGVLTVTGAASDVSFGQLDLANVSGVLELTQEKLDARLEPSGTLKLAGIPSDLSGNAMVSLDFAEQSGELNIDAMLADEQISTPDPIKIRFGEDRGLDGRVSALGGEIDVSASSAGSPLSLQLRGLDLANAGHLVGRPGLVGLLSGNIGLERAGNGLAGDAQVSMEGLGRKGLEDLPKATLSLDAVLEEDRISGEARLDGGDTGYMLNGEFGIGVVQAAEAWNLRVDRTQPVDVSIAGQAAIAPLWAIASPPDLRLAGLVELDVSGRAPMDEFRLTGPIAVLDGEFEDGQTGLYLKDIEIDGMLSERSLEIVSTRALGGRGGRVSGSGLYRFDGSGQVNLRLDKLDALGREDFTAILSGPLSLDRENSKTVIEGDLTVDEARIDLAALPQGGYTTIDVTFDEPSEADEDTVVREALSLDVKVRADRRIFVVAPYANSEWAVDMRVRGNPGALDLSGAATLIRGQADLLSRQFRLNDGEIRFNGPPQDTRLDVSADRKAGEYTARIGISGSVMSPDISLSSEPALPEDEVLSLVLFGKSPSQLSAFEAAQLAGAAASLANGGGGFDIVRPIQSATGLQRLDIGQDDEGAFAVTTGTYLADDVYLEIVTGSSGTPGVSLEWTPLDNIEIDTELDPEEGPRFAIQWKRDFDRLGLPGGDEEE